MKHNGKPIKVGDDIDNAETARHQGMGLAARYIAEVWRKTIFPVSYERTFDIGGTQVSVSVGEKKQAEKIRVSDEQFRHE